MKTPRKKITSIWTLARRGIEPRSSGPIAIMLTTMQCHFIYKFLRKLIRLQRTVVISLCVHFEKWGCGIVNIIDLIWVGFWTLVKVTPLHDTLPTLSPTLKDKFIHKRKKIFFWNSLKIEQLTRPSNVANRLLRNLSYSQTKVFQLITAFKYSWRNKNNLYQNTMIWRRIFYIKNGV